MPDFVVGVDLGQAQDPTAAVVAELAERDLHVRHLERLPLRTPYPDVVKRIAALMKALPGPGTLVVDATGVGRPVIDLLRDAKLAPVAVTFTSGKAATFDDDAWHVPKRDLVRALLVAVEGGRFKVARLLPLAATLKRELRAFRRRITPRRNDTFNGAGVHDDLLIAAALVCWQAGHR